MADPLTLGAGAVLWAVTTVTSGALSGAGESLRQRGGERLSALLVRVRRRRGGAEEALAVQAPTTDAERRQVERELLDGCVHHPADAAQLAELVQEMNLLRRDVTSAPAVRHVAAPDASTPRLPSRTRDFTNRDEALRRVRRMVDDADEEYGPPPVVLLGPAGIGKSALALHLAHDVAERFPDPALHAELRGASARQASDPAAVLRRFLRLLGLPDVQVPADPESQADLFRAVTATQRRLVLLDNAFSYAQVLPLFPAGASSFVLVTTRYRQVAADLVANQGALVVDVGPLSTDDARLLLTRKVGGERAARHREHVDTIVDWCRGVPQQLASLGGQVAAGGDLETTARRLAGRDVASAADVDSALDGDRPSGAEEPVDDRGTELAYRELSTPAARLYRALGMFPWPDLPVSAVAVAVETTVADARTRLTELDQVHLVEESADGRYRLPDSVRPHAERSALAEDGPGGYATVAERLTTWYLRFAQEADFRAMEHRWRLAPYYAQLRRADHGAPRDASTRRQALDQLATERENLAEAVRIAEEYRLDNVAWQLCEAMWTLHLKLGFHEQWIVTHRLGLASARRAVAAFDDPRAPARLLTQLSFAHARLGQYEQAVDALTEAAAIDREVGHGRGEASALEALGLVRLRQLRFPDAEECFAGAERVWNAVGPRDEGVEDAPRARALLIHHRARALRPQDRFAQALELMEDALARFGALPQGPDRYNEDRVRMSIGETWLDAGDPATARATLTAAYEKMAVDGAVEQQAYAAELIGVCAERLAELDDAARWFTVAAERFRSAEDHGSAARADARRATVTGAPGGTRDDEDRPGA